MNIRLYEDTGLNYNRHRYYDPRQGRYITQDPIGLRGGWNFYKYPYNPAQRIDPQGLFDGNFGSLGDGGFGSFCAANESAMRHLPPEDVIAVLDNNAKMHNVYNPLSEYVYGIAVLPSVVGMSAINAGASLARRVTACVKDTVESVIKDGERDPKAIALTCGKGFLNEGAPDWQSKISDFLIDSLASYSQKQ